jgi:hypothetical protein
MLSFYFTYRQMSPKKSPSNIRPEDREEFNTKLQALHQELQKNVTLDKQSERNWHAWEYHNGLDLIVPRMARECSYPCIDEHDNIYHRRITHADRIQSIVYWDKAAMDYLECRSPFPIRKLIQEQYTDGEDRAIGGIIA